MSKKQTEDRSRTTEDYGPTLPKLVDIDNCFPGPDHIFGLLSSDFRLIFAGLWVKRSWHVLQS